jgi:BMFP domain-containing protein YqiC
VDDSGSTAVCAVLGAVHPPRKEVQMQGDRHWFDDLQRMTTGALGTLTGMRQEIEVRLKEQVERILARMDLVRREEFDAVQAMAAKARAAQEALERRVAALEAQGTIPAAEPAPREPD